jgi:hypothetical protein
MQKILSATASYPIAQGESRAPACVPGQIGRLAAAGVVILAVAAALLATGQQESQQAVLQAGADLTHLLRAMAGLKTLMSAAVLGAIVWRMRAPVTWPFLAGYLAASGAMAAGPALIWGMVHVASGAMLLHGGLLASVLLLWRDPATAGLLSEAVAARRRALAARL